ncbi:arsenate reductase ArsC [Roseibium polysiphoniae]|uniref:Arsenate reductase ArsC n=1 Tax=Roseibium polysiphoniae TaxID=2571221 RepID=A0A927Q5Q7_9HYPH|nr:arsenate reductase ArsC [Roseibium polysiphoniae]MBD8876920.1 arsenate reductase ArsC [Roseibium polysiphoniae]MBS8260902.1 arsenate reductase ArsC [Roseibium polysiphoniae]
MRNVLFVCTANSARSVLGEGLLRHLAGDRYQSFSAGSTPRGTVNPDALECLARHGISAEGFRSKSWDEFSGPDTPAMDLIVTVCDNAAGEACPIWPGHPLVAHWGIADPASEKDDDAERAADFDLAYERMKRRIEAFLALPDTVFDAPDAKAQLSAIGNLND